MVILQKAISGNGTGGFPDGRKNMAVGIQKLDHQLLCLIAEPAVAVRPGMIHLAVLELLSHFIATRAHRAVLELQEQR